MFTVGKRVPGLLNVSGFTSNLGYSDSRMFIKTGITWAKAGRSNVNEKGCGRK